MAEESIDRAAIRAMVEDFWRSFLAVARQNPQVGAESISRFNAARSIITSHAIHAMGGRGARLTFELGERPCYPLPIALPLLIGRSLRHGTDQRVQDAQSRQRQPTIEGVGYAPKL